MDDRLTPEREAEMRSTPSADALREAERLLPCECDHDPHDVWKKQPHSIACPAHYIPAVALALALDKARLEAGLDNRPITPHI